MRIAIFGASGRTGRLLVDAALARGHDVVVAARSNPDPPLGRPMRVVTGDARDPDHVREVVAGAEAVASVMAIREGTEPTTDLSDATSTIVGVLREDGPRRLVITVNASVFHDRPVDPPFGIVADEHRRNVALLRGIDDLDWTVLAPTLLTDADAAGYRATVGAKAPGKGLHRADLATAVVDALGREDWIGRVVGVSN